MNNLLVVFKKNHEQVHDGALSTVISTLDKAKHRPMDLNSGLFQGRRSKGTISWVQRQ